VQQVKRNISTVFRGSCDVICCRSSETASLSASSETDGTHTHVSAPVKCGLTLGYRSRISVRLHFTRLLSINATAAVQMDKKGYLLVPGTLLLLLPMGVPRPLASSLRRLLPISLLGEPLYDGCEQFA